MFNYLCEVTHKQCILYVHYFMSGHYFHTKLRHPLCNFHLKQRTHSTEKIFVDSLNFILPELFIDITNTKENL